MTRSVVGMIPDHPLYGERANAESGDEISLLRWIGPSLPVQALFDVSCEAPGCVVGRSRICCFAV